VSLDVGALARSDTAIPVTPLSTHGSLRIVSANRMPRHPHRPTASRWNLQTYARLAGGAFQTDRRNYGTVTDTCEESTLSTPAEVAEVTT
jgi:hypothetical protein